MFFRAGELRRAYDNCNNNRMFLTTANVPAADVELF